MVLVVFRYCKTCAQIAATAHLDMATRIHYFNEMKSSLEEHKSGMVTYISIKSILLL